MPFKERMRNTVILFAAIWLLLIIFVSDARHLSFNGPRLIALKGGARGDDRQPTLWRPLNVLIKTPKATNKKSSKLPTKSKSIAVPQRKKRSKELSPEEQQAAIKRQKLLTNVQQFILSIASIFGAKYIFKLDYKNPSVLRMARAIFVGYLFLMHMLYIAIRISIANDNNSTIVPIVEPPMSSLSSLLGGLGGSASPLTSLLQGKQSTKKSPPTVREYDLEQNTRIYHGLFTEIVLVTIMHFVLKRHSALVLVPFYGLLNRLKEPLVALHLFRWQAVGPLARPFKSSIELMVTEMSTSEGTESSSQETTESAAEELEKKSVNDSEEEAARDQQEEEKEEHSEDGEREEEDEEAGEDGDGEGEERESREIEELIDSLDSLDE